MNIVLSVHKPISFTPNQIIEKVRLKFPHFAKEKIGFAGRLDPMAQGVLLLLVGDANFEREKYLNLDKTYQFQALLGLETDSYDLLGLLTEEKSKTPPDDYQPLIEQFITESIGKKIQPYPPFSTKPVAGKELFKWAREGKIDQIEIPTKEIEIYKFKQLSKSEITAEELDKLIAERINKVEGFFRQEEILKKWHSFFKGNNQTSFPILKFEVKCSSGTYIRSLVHNLGQRLGCGAVTIEIFRTEVGEYSVEKCLNLNI